MEESKRSFGIGIYIGDEEFEIDSDHTEDNWDEVDEGNEDTNPSIVLPKIRPSDPVEPGVHPC